MAEGDQIFNYAGLDAFKLAASAAAAETAGNLLGSGFSEEGASRGESAFVFQNDGVYMAGVLEGLGTKNLVADAYDQMHPEGRSGYYGIAQDNLAMINNDLAVSGARPLFFWMHHAVAGDDWFSDARRVKDYVEGTRDACNADGMTWAAGETPGLSGVIVPGASEISGFSLGVIGTEDRYVRGDTVDEGDRFLVLESSGIHANGLSAARRLADELPEGYATEVDGSGNSFAEELLTPTVLYSSFVQNALNAGVKFKRLENMTGHGWRKVMRGPGEFTYRVTGIPEQMPIFRFLQQHLRQSTLDMYGYYNMGGGFVAYVDRENEDGVREAAQRTGHEIVGEGVVEHGPKQVVLEPLDEVLPGDSLNLRN